MAGSLAVLLRDRARLTSMQAQAERSAAKWDWDRLAVQMEDIYQAARSGVTVGS
jgi:hypothetical protein